MKTAFDGLRRGAFAISCAAAALVCSTVWAEGRDGRDDDRGDRFDESQIRRGFEIVPAGLALNLTGKNRALVGLGSYIVNTTGCNDCHTHRAYAPGGDPFQGQPEMINVAQYLAGGRTFPPSPFVAANITPDYAGKPAGLTLKAFISVLRTGHDPPDPVGDLLQVMPWPVFGKKTDRDLTAIYEYLRAIPALPNNPNAGPEP